MPTKIVGFILSKTPISYVPKINSLMKTKVLKGSWGELVLFGSRDIEPLAPGVWSLGFPPSSDLLQHNLLLTVGPEEVKIESDWIGGIPVFYNLKEQIVSTYAKVCLGKDQTFDDEGLYLFLRYGFSVFGTTPFRSVKSLRYYSALHFSTDGLSVTEKEDPALTQDLSVSACEEDIRVSIKEDLDRVFHHTSEAVVCPLSGGLDSRVLCSLIPEEQRSRVSTYTFGVSPRQEKSFEAQIARSVAGKLNLSWQHVPLSKAYDYVEEWHDLFGFATHLHGMNHIEFLKKIKEDFPDVSHPVLLSGLTGGAFSGGYLGDMRVDHPNQLYKLALTHDLNAGFLLPAKVTQAETRFFEQNSALLVDPRWYSVVSMRLKMGLLHYLYKLPDHLGFSSCSPYHNFSTVTKMLSLPPNRLHNRHWVKEYFKKEGLHFKTRIFHGDTRNTLNRQLFEGAPHRSLNVGLWENSPVPLDKVKVLNSFFETFPRPTERIKHFLSSQRVVKEVVKVLGWNSKFNQYLPAYQTMKSLEMSLLDGFDERP